MIFSVTPMQTSTPIPVHTSATVQTSKLPDGASSGFPDVDVDTTEFIATGVFQNIYKSNYLTHQYR